ncbi:helix-turn-helix domain-containing protein [Cellulomonas cellasea]|uniref:Excisionase family DNA binding protein n=1 Tax=Cellulomonas cellasea TaxID=43670 RepID=A0A7W4YD69_9CELL|nr:helix-turn-helix domain-containing protein [Cellulomonas cellasea]MBB2925493.1 excisionase family DNA binding protein [Cellulomonas cellasea]
MSTDFRARLELATRDAPHEPALAALGTALVTTGHTALGWVELHLTLTADDLGTAATDAVARATAATGLPVLAVEVLPRAEADARAGIIPSPTTIGVPETAVLLGITEQAVRHKLRTGRLAGRREGRDWRIQRAEVDRVRAARDAPAEG